jgi:hypothetical protein
MMLATQHSANLQGVLNAVCAATAQVACGRQAEVTVSTKHCSPI